MQVFSRLARKLMNEEFRAALGAASDADAVVTLLANELNLPR
jgi:fructose-specific PTS system IIA-like component